MRGELAIVIGWGAHLSPPGWLLLAGVQLRDSSPVPAPTNEIPRVERVSVSSFVSVEIQEDMAQYIRVLYVFIAVPRLVHGQFRRWLIKLNKRRDLILGSFSKDVWWDGG